MTCQYQYLLDTNILSDLVRKPQGNVAKNIARVGERIICTSIIVASELRFGAEKRNFKALTNQINTILSAVDILPFEVPSDLYYAETRNYLERKGQSIGPNDLLIAAHCLSLDCIMVTANTREFSRIPKLRVENWL